MRWAESPSGTGPQTHRARAVRTETKIKRERERDSAEFETFHGNSIRVAAPLALLIGTRRTMSRHVLRVAYDGHTFRSKTEAQWARCFELLGLAYQYEPTVVRLERGHGRVAHYKPDFYLPSLGCWLEIKNEGTKAPDLVAAWKAHRLAVVLGEPVYVFFGPPMGRRNLACGNAYRYAPTTGAVTRGHQFTQCPRCATPAITPYGLVGGVDCACADKLNFSNASSVAIVDAETSARGYAFRTLGH